MENLNQEHHINVGNDEESAAVVIAAMGNSVKRRMDDPDAAAGGSYKFLRAEDPIDLDAFEPFLWGAQEEQHVHPELPIAADENIADLDAVEQVALKPYPYFFYVDYSTEPDKDPLTPLTPPGRVPNFPSKMHAILAREDLKGIICWLPHGRAWKVHDSKEFEKKVLPIYFEHAKYSSFIRQANGWGFRRFTTGQDRNAYYHPRFLRGLPHLCKDMKRPGVSKKLAADADHEPDLERINQEHPVPTNALPDESLLLHCTVQNGPKARMPIYSGSFLYKPKIDYVSSSITPSDHEFLSAFQHSLGASEQQLQDTNAPAVAAAAPVVSAPVGATSTGELPLPICFANQVQQTQNFYPSSQAASSLNLSLMLPASSAMEQVQAPKISSLSAANQLAFSNAAAQFAAGFAAAMGMLAPQAGVGPNMFEAMMTNNNMVAAEAVGPQAPTLPHQDGDFVAQAPMPPMLDGDAIQQPQVYSVAPPIPPTSNELKPPPT